MVVTKGGFVRIAFRLCDVGSLGLGDLGLSYAVPDASTAIELRAIVRVHFAEVFSRIMGISNIASWYELLGEGSLGC
jgi:hypothetical protein